MFTAGDAAHLCAVAMEYELFSASKLPVTYKASVMKRVGEVRKSSGQCNMHPALIPHTAAKYAVSAAGQTLVTSVENPSPFKDVSSSSVDSMADNYAMRMVPDIHCDKDNVALSLTAHESYLSKKCADSCDIGKSDDIKELCGSVQTSLLGETMASDRSSNVVDDCNSQINDLRDMCKTRSHVNISHDVDDLSVISVKSESHAADTMLAAATSKSLKKKSVRISLSPPTVRYTDWQHKEVCNGTSRAIVEVN